MNTDKFDKKAEEEVRKKINSKVEEIKKEIRNFDFVECTDLMDKVSSQYFFGEIDGIEAQVYLNCIMFQAVHYPKSIKSPTTKDMLDLQTVIRKCTNLLKYIDK